MFFCAHKKPLELWGRFPEGFPKVPLEFWCNAAFYLQMAFLLHIVN